MSADVSHAVAALNHLTTACKNSQEAYETAMQTSTAIPDRAVVFRDLAQQRKQFAAALITEVRRLGGDPDKTAGLGGAVDRLAIQAARAVGSDGTVLSRLASQEDSLVSDYEDTLQNEWPLDTHELLRQHYDAIVQARDRIRAMERPAS
jgi:uncharacterized protein (TIGR02284 family)